VIKLLLVEDNEINLDMIVRRLKKKFELVIARPGTEAVAKAKAEAPAVILMDVGLPDIDGLEVARRLRGNAALAGTRLIALTGYGQAEDVRQAIEAGFDAHVTKPINLDQLMALLARRDEPLTGARGAG
jgi:CheY-like chemotaxis protein